MYAICDNGVFGGKYSKLYCLYWSIFSNNWWCFMGYHRQFWAGGGKKYEIDKVFFVGTWYYFIFILGWLLMLFWHLFSCILILYQHKMEFIKEIMLCLLQLLSMEPCIWWLKLDLLFIIILSGCVVSNVVFPWKIKKIVRPLIKLTNFGLSNMITEGKMTTITNQIKVKFQWFNHIFKIITGLE